LVTAFPQAESALAAAAGQAQEAAALAAEVWAQDLPTLLDEANGLQTATWVALPPARRRNALRGWLQHVLGRGAPEALLTRLSAELPGRRTATWDAPGRSLRLYRGVLRAAAPPHETAHLGAQAAVLDLSAPGCYPMPAWGGRWRIDAAHADGVAAPLLKGTRAAPRSGGEQFSLAPGATARSLKKQFQALGIPAWQRSGPLLFSSDGRLIWVPGLGVDARCRASVGERQLSVSWEADRHSATGQRQCPG
jgi:tRNA(Ile)-lysidine synthase